MMCLLFFVKEPRFGIRQPVTVGITKNNIKHLQEPSHTSSDFNTKRLKAHRLVYILSKLSPEHEAYLVKSHPSSTWSTRKHLRCQCELHKALLLSLSSVSLPIVRHFHLNTIEVETLMKFLVVHAWDNRHWSVSQANFLLFCSIWSILILAYLVIAPMRFLAAAYKFATLGIDAITMIFWFAGFIAFSVLIGDSGCSSFFSFCRVSQAAAVFGAFEWYGFRSS